MNLTGAFNCAQAVWPHMKERGWGRIVNMASVAGTLGGFGQASYSTTKAGVLGLTKTLAMEGGRHGITCNAIVPGIIGTEAFHMANAAMNERIVDADGAQAAGRAAGHRERDRVPLLRPRGVHHRRRAVRLRRRRAVRVLSAFSWGTPSHHPLPILLGECAQLLTDMPTDERRFAHSFVTRADRSVTRIRASVRADSPLYARESAVVAAALTTRGRSRPPAGSSSCSPSSSASRSPARGTSSPRGPRSRASTSAA